MMTFKFVWDLEKSAGNIKKHGIAFEEAQTVFFDEHGREYYDPGHSELDEDRFLFLGISSKMKLLLVCYCFRENDSTIRIFSARKATKKESQHYRRSE